MALDTSFHCTVSVSKKSWRWSQRCARMQAYTVVAHLRVKHMALNGHTICIEYHKRKPSQGLADQRRLWGGAWWCTACTARHWRPHLQAVDGTSYVFGEVWMPGFVNKNAVPGVSLKQVGRVDGPDEEGLMRKHLEQLAARCNKVCPTNRGDGLLSCRHACGASKFFGLYFVDVQSQYATAAPQQHSTSCVPVSSNVRPLAGVTAALPWALCSTSPNSPWLTVHRALERQVDRLKNQQHGFQHSTHPYSLQLFTQGLCSVAGRYWRVVPHWLHHWYVRMCLYGTPVSIYYTGLSTPMMARPTMYMTAILGVCCGFSYAVQQSAGRLMGLLPNDTEVNKYLANKDQ